MKGAEHPDVFTAVFQFPDFMATWTLNYDNAYENGWSILFQAQGTMILDEDGYRVFAEPWKRAAEPVYQEKAPVPIESHIQNFLDRIKSREEPNCPVRIAAQAVTGPDMANQAFLKGRKVGLAVDGASIIYRSGITARSLEKERSSMSTVLVLEDSLRVRPLIVRILEDAGFVVSRGR